MSQGPETAPAPRPVRLWGLFLPIIFVAVLAAGWSGFWFYAANRADAAIDAWLAKEATRGRAYACERRSLTGFPFRAVLTCEKPSAVIATTDGILKLSAPRFATVAQVYDPDRMIGELDGPVAVTTPDGRVGELSYDLAQASLGLDGRRFDRVSLVVDAPRLTEGPDKVADAKKLELHVRRAPGGVAGAYDVALTLDAADSALLGALPLGDGPMSVRLQAEARGIDDSMQPKSPVERLRAFAENNGNVHVSLVKVNRGGLAAEARGDVTIDRQGRIAGAGDLVARGVDGIVQDLLAGGKKSGLAALLGVGAEMLGAPTELDGARATSYRVSAEKGKVAIGPIKVYKLPPLF